MGKITLKDFEGKHYLHGFHPGYEPDGETQNAILRLDDCIYKLKEHPNHGQPSYLEGYEAAFQHIKMIIGDWYELDKLNHKN